MTGWEVHHADWLVLARSLAPGSVDLVYADPPFNTGAVKATPPNAQRAERAVVEEYEIGRAHV